MAVSRLYVPSLIVSVLAFLSVSSCVSLKTSLDKRGLQDIAAVLAGGPDIPDPEVIQSYLQSYKESSVHYLDLPFEPVSMDRESFTRWKLSDKKAGGPVIAEKLSFGTTLGLPDGSLDTGYFYLFHREPLAGGKAILWAPGFGVSDFAFNFIHTFIETALAQGWSVLVWVPPYHLERMQQGKKAGEGLISTDLRSLLSAMRSSAWELAAGIAWLEAQGITRVGAWGGSFGAANLLMLGEAYKFDHLSLMIPLIDWLSVWQSQALVPVHARFAKAGYSSEFIASILGTISPKGHIPLTPPDRIQFLYARHDQVSPEQLVLDYAASLGKPEVHAFNESHGTILLNSRVYKAYGKFLERMNLSPAECGS